MNAALGGSSATNIVQRAPHRIPTLYWYHGCSTRGHGWGRFGKVDECIPTVFRVYRHLFAQLKRSRTSRIVTMLLVLEAIATCLRHKHVALFSDNSLSISWVTRMATRSSKVAADLLMALALRMKDNEASPLTPLHIPGKNNKIADILSRLFEATPKLHCKTDEEFLQLFNSNFPLPNQQSWQLYKIPTKLSMRVISILLMKDSELAEWRQLPTRRANTGTSGPNMSNLWELTLTWQKTQQNLEKSQGAHGICRTDA